MHIHMDQCIPLIHTYCCVCVCVCVYIYMLGGESASHPNINQSRADRQSCALPRVPLFGYREHIL